MHTEQQQLMACSFMIKTALEKIQVIGKNNNMKVYITNGKEKFYINDTDHLEMVFDLTEQRHYKY